MTIIKAKTILMEMFKGTNPDRSPKKVAECDITRMQPRQRRELIALQKMQGRTCQEKTIKPYTFPDFDREKEGER